MRGFENVRVMVIDDDVSAATSMYDLLEVMGCKAAMALGGRLAEPIARSFKPDLVLLDLAMPGQDGFEVLATVKAVGDPLRPAIYACVSGHSSQDTESRCLAAGFDHFIPKPLAFSRLRQLLEDAMRRRTVAPSVPIS